MVLASQPRLAVASLDLLELPLGLVCVAPSHPMVPPACPEALRVPDSGGDPVGEMPQHVSHHDRYKLHAASAWHGSSGTDPSPIGMVGRLWCGCFLGGRYHNPTSQAYGICATVNTGALSLQKGPEGSCSDVKPSKALFFPLAHVCVAELEDLVGNLPGNEFPPLCKATK